MITKFYDLEYRDNNIWEAPVNQSIENGDAVEETGD